MSSVMVPNDIFLAGETCSWSLLSFRNLILFRSDGQGSLQANQFFGQLPVLAFHPSAVGARRRLRFEVEVCRQCYKTCLPASQRHVNELD
jgi:hypothetical protein